MTLLCATQGCVDRQVPDYTELRTGWQTVSAVGNIDEFWQESDALGRREEEDWKSPPLIG
jgi:hypothetical protein